MQYEKTHHLSKFAKFSIPFLTSRVKNSHLLDFDGYHALVGGDFPQYSGTERRFPRRSVRSRSAHLLSAIADVENASTFSYNPTPLCVTGIRPDFHLIFTSILYA